MVIELDDKQKLHRELTDVIERKRSMKLKKRIIEFRLGKKLLVSNVR